MKIPHRINRLLTRLYLRRRGVEWSGEIPQMDMLHPPKFMVYGKLTLGSGVRFATHLGRRTLIQVDKGASIRIGDCVDFNNVSWIRASNEIVIEDNVHIGPDVTIFDSNMHPLFPGDPDTPRRVRLGRNSVIFSGCRILRGVHIGEHSVVGAGSVVTRSVEPKTEVAGNPARHIRSFTNPDYPEGWIRT